MINRLAKWLLTAAATMMVSVIAFAVAVDTPLADPKQEALARSIMKEIRCVVCQNQSIEDSNADLAKDLRILIRERVAAGETAQDIETFLVARYGEWVLLKPPVNQSTYFLWASPFLVLLVLAAVLVARRKALPQTEPLSAKEEAKLADILRNDP